MNSDRRFVSIDGLRGIAVLAVLLFHVKYFMVPDRVEPKFLDLGWAGVDLFFVISGFLITGILWDSRERASYLKTFYARRSLRIFPLYFLVLLLVYGGPAALLGGRELIHAQTQAWAWLYVVNIGMALSVLVSPLIQHFWSLSIEEQFYLAWPFVVRRCSRRGLMRVCAGMVVLSLVLRVVLFHYGMSMAAYTLTICRLDSLAIGAVIALAMRDPADWRVLIKYLPHGLAAIAIALLTLVYFASAFAGLWMRTLGVSLFGLFFGGCIVWAVEYRSAVFEAPPLRFFGKYSYCLYCVHQPLMLLLLANGFDFAWLGKFTGRPLVTALVLNLLIIGACTALAMASWNLYEKHFLKLKNSFR